MTRAAATFCVLLAALLVTVSADVRAVQSPAAPSHHATLLTPGQSIEKTVDGSDRHEYELELPAGDVAVVVLDQRGVDLVVRVLDATGSPVVTVDDDPRKDGRERVAVVADSPGRTRLSIAARYSKHEPGAYAIRVEEVRSATDRDRALYTSRQLATAATALKAAGKFADAFANASSALTLAESALGPNDPYVASLLFSLAGIARSKGTLPQAEQAFQRAVAIARTALGSEHPLTGIYEEGYGLMLATAKDDYARAEPLMVHGTAIVRRALGEGPQYAVCLRDLALMHRERGDYNTALAELREALQIADRTMSADDFDAIVIVNNLGDLYVAMDDLDHAQPLTERTLHDLERTLGRDHFRVSYPLMRLAIIARDRGEYDQALAYLQRAYAIREKAYGKEHADTAALLVTIGNVYHAMKNYDRALAAYETAEAVLERTAGPYHSYTVTAVNDAARTCLAAGDLDGALRFYTRMAAALDKLIAFNLAIGSEREKLAYLQTTFESMGRMLSLHLRYAPDSRDAADLAAAAVLRRKGRVLDALSDSHEALRASMEPADRELLDNLAASTRKLSHLALSGPTQTPYPEFKKQLAALETQHDALEREISGRSARFRIETQEVTPASIRAALPAATAVLEFAIYRPIDPQAVGDDDARGSAHYAVYVLRRDAETRGIDLGPAPAIDAAVRRLREALRDPSRRDVVTVARALDVLTLRPIRPLLGNARQLLIAPDGALNLVPFEALVDERGRYEVERYAISYLGSGRDVLRMEVARATGGPPLVIADPAFGEPPPVVPAGVEARRASPHPPSQPVYFAPLAGTAEEAAAIGRLLPGAVVLTGPRATKDALAKAAAPSILHIASHAFFLPADGTDAHAPVADTRAMTASVTSRNPLLRSGIAFAGANLSGGDAGILTALEASTLNLWGTKLATLSACDTGVGDVTNGEGVYGLRRAFFVAGAETLVMTLWPVSDYVTRTVMTRYYAGLARGQGRGEALRRVQLAMLADRQHRHPFYWAGFIQAGDWRPIR